MSQRKLERSTRTEQPLVTVIMNCYNGARFVREAIDSIFAQTYENWEIVFWDNLSTDASAAIAQDYDDPRMRYYRAPHHTLLYAARNQAISHARGTLLAFLDVDDIWTSQKLERQVPLFDDAAVGFSCTNYWLLDERHARQRLFRKKKFPQGEVLNAILNDYPVGLLTLVVRRAAFDLLEGGCDPHLHLLGDIDLVVRLAVNWKMACIEEPLAFYRLHEENESKREPRRRVEEYEAWVLKLAQMPSVVGLPGYRTALNQLAYVRGRWCLDQERRRDAIRYLQEMSWGMYKVKLLALTAKAIFV